MKALRSAVAVLACGALVSVVALAAFAAPNLARSASRAQYTPPVKSSGGGGGGGGGNPNLGIGIGASSSSISPGGSVSFTITVKNTGVQTGSNVILTIQLGSGMQLQGPPAFDRGSGCIGTTQLICNLDFLPVGTVATILFGVNIPGSSDQTLQASVTSSEADLNLADNSLSYPIRVGAPASTSAPATTKTQAKGSSKAKCIVPSLIGKPIAAATKAIVKVGCVVGKITNHSFFHLPKASVNTVTAQTPAAGLSVKKNTAVKLTVAVASKAGSSSAASSVAAGVTSCKVPKVVGLPLATAWNTVLKADCLVDKISYVHSTKAKAGSVTAVLPAAGSHLAKGGKVKLTVAKK